MAMRLPSFAKSDDFISSVGLDSPSAGNEQLEALQAKVDEKKSSVEQQDRELKELEARIQAAEEQLKEKERLAADQGKL